MNNKQTILEMYEAFGRGDVPAILDKLSDSVEWDYSGNSSGLPWLKYRRGKEEVKNFFAAVSEMDFKTFDPKEFLEGDDLVVAILDIDAIYKPNGNRFGERDAVHIWRFDADGKVVSFRHGIDTYQHYLAYTGRTAATNAGSI